MGRPLLLALRALGLGDVLTAVPALRGLRRAYPHHRIVVAAPAPLHPLMPLIGGIDGFIPTEPLQTPEVPRPHVAVNLHGAGPQSHRALLALRPSSVVAFEHPDVPEVDGSPAWKEREHEVARWCRLVEWVGGPCDKRDLALRSPAAPPPPEGLTVVHPGAAKASRRWPFDRWAAVVSRLTAGGHRVVITGSAEERPLCRRLARDAGLPGPAVLAGRTDVASLAGLIAAARCVLSGDTGVAHLAFAYGTPSITLYGPTPPHLWGPPIEREQHRVIHKGGHGDPHADIIDARLDAIGVPEVLAQIEMLERSHGVERIAHVGGR
jgi:ADP-heptose:LPS heptosyltransferase